MPAHRRPYGGIDRAIHHYRRYDGADLVERIRDAGFRVERTWFFNRLGALGWYLNSVILGRTRLPGLQLRLQNLLVPLLRAESALRLPFGLSLIAVGRKGPPGDGDGTSIAR